MKLKYFLWIAVFSFLACKTQKKIIESNSEDQTQIFFKQVYDANAQELDGMWKLVGIDSYGQLDSEGKIEEEDITWSFFKNEDNSTSLYTTAPIKGNRILADNKYQYWTDGCLLQINQKTYLYKVHLIKDLDGRTAGRDLTVYENTDPGLADGGSIYRFRSMDTFWACGVVHAGVDEEPQVINLIPGPVQQAYTPSPNLKGKWRLEQLSAPTSELPNYKNNEVVWEFLEGKTMNEISISKSSLKIKNDYSLSAGKHQFWINECVIKIGKETLSYEIQNEGKEETLILTDDLNPGIADHNKYIFKRI